MTQNKGKHQSVATPLMSFSAESTCVYTRPTHTENVVPPLAKMPSVVPPPAHQRPCGQRPMVPTTCVHLANSRASDTVASICG